jgi:hypothetical protein
VNAVAVIQANYTDLLADDRDPAHYCLEPLRRSRRIDRTVIAAPICRKPCALAAAATWCRPPSGQRVRRDLEDYRRGASGGRYRTRRRPCLVNRFFLDIDLVDRMIDLLEQDMSDFVTLPCDFNINFGADVMTLGCLRRAEAMMASADMAQRFRPWLFIEERTDVFRVSCLEDVPTYPRECWNTFGVAPVS